MLPQLPLKWHPLLYILYLSTMKYKLLSEFRLRLSSIQAYCEAFAHFVSVSCLTYSFGVYTACLLCTRIFVSEFPGARTWVPPSIRVYWVLRIQIYLICLSIRKWACTGLSRNKPLLRIRLWLWLLDPGIVLYCCFVVIRLGSRVGLTDWLEFPAFWY
jgi:hypothetical protein